MKLRSQRTHHMGVSNREKERMAMSKDVFENSFIKSQSSHFSVTQQPQP